MKKIFVLILGVLTLTLAACSGGATSSSSAAQQITIEASEFNFQPATIEVSAGRPVKLVMRNKGAVEHDWAIMKIPMMGKNESSMGGHDMSGVSNEPELHLNVALGRTGQVEFTPTEKGTYQIACTVAGHKEAGMVGTLVVK